MEIIRKKVNDLHYTNMNAMCFVAIEFKNAVSRKHLLGGAINCSALGKIGIAIGFTDSKHRAFCNLQRYFQFLESVNKPTYSTKNLVIISNPNLNFYDISCDGIISKPFNLDELTATIHRHITDQIEIRRDSGFN